MHTPLSGGRQIINGCGFRYELSDINIMYIMVFVDFVGASSQKTMAVKMFVVNNISLGYPTLYYFNKVHRPH